MSPPSLIRAAAAVEQPPLPLLGGALLRIFGKDGRLVTLLVMPPPSDEAMVDDGETARRRSSLSGVDEWRRKAL